MCVCVWGGGRGGVSGVGEWVGGKGEEWREGGIGRDKEEEF